MIDKIRKCMRGEQGFTLVEMMVVLIIIAVLIAVGIRAYVGYIGTAKMTKAKGDISTMQGALDSYYATNGNYPLIASLGNAGLTMATGVPLGTYLYGYDSDGAATYGLWSVTSVNGNYMVGTGDSGVSDTATLSGSTP